MTTIDPGQRLAAALQQEVAALRGREGPQGPAAGTRAFTGQPQAQRVGGTLAQRIEAIAPDDPHRQRKAFRVFLETALLRELGDDLVRDAAFASMVDSVEQRMHDDAQLARAAQDLGRYLLDQARA